MEKQSIIKVASNSTPGKVAGYISRAIKDQQEVQLHVIGAGAVNQSVKAIAIARGYVMGQGIDLHCIPAFDQIDIKGRETTSIRLIVKSVKLSA